MAPDGMTELAARDAALAPDRRPARPRVPGRLPAAWAITGLTAALALAVVVAVTSGAFQIRPGEAAFVLLHALGLGPAEGFTAQQEAVLTTIRLPRVALAVAVGAGLAAAGTALQALFRNPLADPTLIGVAGGAALAAATVIVMGVVWLPGLTRILGPATLPLVAFAGGLAAATLVYRIATHSGRTAIAVLLLAGIAVNALVEAGIGSFTYIANDEQLRNLAFWRLGSVGGASWTILAYVAPAICGATLVLWRLAAPFNALALGEAEARHLGIDVQWLKIVTLVAAALAVGAAVAVSGIIMFIGLVAPHMVRLACGPDHRVVLPGAALLGATLVLVADTVARTVAAPAELPLGVFTALIGVPFFVALLLRERRAWSL
jgi:iron complex transport system permease protein